LATLRIGRHEADGVDHHYRGGDAHEPSRQSSLQCPANRNGDHDEGELDRRHQPKHAELELTGLRDDHEEDERAPVRQLADGVDEEHPAAQSCGAGLAIDGICRQDDVRGRLDADLQGRSESVWSRQVATLPVRRVIE